MNENKPVNTQKFNIIFPSNLLAYISQEILHPLHLIYVQGRSLKFLLIFKSEAIMGKNMKSQSNSWVEQRGID